MEPCGYAAKATIFAITNIQKQDQNLLPQDVRVQQLVVGMDTNVTNGERICAGGELPGEFATPSCENCKANFYGTRE